MHRFDRTSGLQAASTPKETSASGRQSVPSLVWAYSDDKRQRHFMVRVTYTSGFSIFKTALNVVRNAKVILDI